MVVRGKQSQAQNRHVLVQVHHKRVLAIAVQQCLTTKDGAEEAGML